MRIDTAFLVGALLAFAGGAVASQGPESRAQGAPLSAIDWLSDSIAIPAPPTAAPAVAPPPSADAPDVTVIPLDRPVPDRAGLVDARDIGLPADLWGRSSAADLARQIAAIPEPRSWALRSFLVDLLAARLDPPIDAVVDDSHFLARLDKLLELGDLDTAEALIRAAGAPEPRRFRRQFDIALLKGTETRACATIEVTPELSPTYPARIFCLARNGQWDVAALTLGTAEALGILAPDEDRLLLHFLDSHLFAEQPLPPPPPQMSPLTFRLYEAVGERPSTEPLPVAFAHADLSNTVGWKTRLRAGERLAAAGALPFERLLVLFEEREPAASGGIWTRVAAIQEFHQAVRSGEAGRVTATLPPAFEAAHAGGYAAALAEWALPRISGLQIGSPARHALFEMALLSDDVPVARRYAGDGPEERTLLAAAEGRPYLIEPSTPLRQSIRRSLSGLVPGEGYRLLLRDGRPGEALVRAVTVLATGSEGDPSAIGDALALLRALGLSDLARRVAVELLLEEARA